LIIGVDQSESGIGIRVPCLAGFIRTRLYGWQEGHKWCYNMFARRYWYRFAGKHQKKHV